jgi:hypothetical protein
VALIKGRIGYWLAPQYRIYGAGAIFVGLACLGFGAWTLIDWLRKQKK